MKQNTNAVKHGTAHNLHATRASSDSGLEIRVRDDGAGFDMTAPAPFAQVGYMHEEVRVLKELLEAATGKKRIAFTAEQRRRLALKGKDLTAKVRAACCQIVGPETLLALYRNLGARNYDSSKTRKAGRPRKPDQIRALVLRLASENPRRGYTKIRDALRGLEIEIGRTTVANILAEEGMDPTPYCSHIHRRDCRMI